MLYGLVVVTLATLASSGCARRAYNDVYVENMAAEVRELEDQLYEYDSEYRALEREVQSLQAENARLQSSLANSMQSGSAGRNNRGTVPQSLPQASPPSLPLNSSTSPSDFGSRGSGRQDVVSPGTVQKSPSNASGTPSIAPSNTPSNTPSSAPSPAPQLEGSAGGKSNLPPSSTLPPSSMLPPSNLPPSTLPAPKSVPGRASDKYEDLQPPTIEPGEAMPPTMPLPNLNSQSSTTTGSSADLELELGRIAIPGQLASTGQASDRSSRLQAATSPMPSDTRIVEMKFHPSLCRAINIDEQGDDDGLYLVLQPLNEAGQFVPVAADLMVLAVDLSRDEKHATIGRWTLSASEVKNKLQPIGSSQGIHLSLPFAGSAPGCDRVLVFVYYTLTDGRRVVAEQEVLLNNAHRQSTVWVPRAKGAVPNSPASAVRTASATR